MYFYGYIYTQPYREIKRITEVSHINMLEKVFPNLIKVHIRKFYNKALFSSLDDSSMVVHLSIIL